MDDFNKLIYYAIEHGSTLKCHMEFAGMIDSFRDRLEQLETLESATMTFISRSIVDGVKNDKVKEGYHVEIRTDMEAWQGFWSSLPKTKNQHIKSPKI